MKPQVFSPDDWNLLEKSFPNVPRETFLRIHTYANLFWEWNHHINLTGEKCPRDFLFNQIGDCLSAADIIPQSTEWIDVGTGGGLPGIVWAMLQPRTKFYLIESIQKKASFLQRALVELKISNAQIFSERFEKLSLGLESNEKIWIVSRGAASPDEILELAEHSPIAWEKWIVFSSEKTHAQFLTLAEKFGMKAEAFSYERRPTGPGKYGLLSVLQR